MPVLPREDEFTGGIKTRARRAMEAAAQDDASTLGDASAQGTVSDQGPASTQGTASAQGPASTQGTPSAQGTASAQGSATAQGPASTQDTASAHEIVGSRDQTNTTDQKASMSATVEAPTQPSFDLSTLMLMLQRINENQDRLKDMSKAQEKRLQDMSNAQEKRLQDMSNAQEKRLQDMSNAQEKRLQDMSNAQEKRLQDMSNAQEKRLQHMSEDQQLVLAAISKVSNVVDQIRKDVDYVENRVADLENVVENRVTSLEINFSGLEKKILRLEADYSGMKNKLSELNNQIQRLKTVGVTGMSSTHHPQMKVPSYDGTTSWPAYQRQFQTVADCNGWNEEQRFAALTVSLKGSALSILETLPSTGSGFKTLMEALEIRYGERHLEHVFRAQLRDRVQRSEEGLQQWALEIERLVRKAYPTENPRWVENNVLQAFVDGIADLEVRAAVKLHHHTSLKDALAHALEIEAVRRDNQLLKLGVINEDVMPKDTPRRSFRTGRMCYKCGERGHLQLSCPQRDAHVEKLGDHSKGWNQSSIRSTGNSVSRLSYNWRTKRDLHKTTRNANSRGFEDGELVWLYKACHQSGKFAELQERWQGPCKIVAQISDVAYAIQQRPGGSLEVVHVDHLALYRGRNSVARDERL